ncbi:LOW QUALITY PROTEIN: protein eva-1 homolog C [Takifugu flavidus]|uniref:LOW QUALITY PROTEIN: protein eva-1 homolog C n=1 Tax=Takifugu flavidus TaxID=433684 RepID=UPI00254460A1|nr:LOW QUALITY PROTEIN: protein eva-1 homolog C [Takifugu flavidus]
MRVLGWTRLIQGEDWSLFCLTFLLWTSMSGLADFSTYLSGTVTGRSAHACDGHPLRLRCPRHATISIQSAFYGSGAAGLCAAEPGARARARHRGCSAFTALQKLLSECQNHRRCQLPVHHLLFGKDPCPGTAKYLHVDYKCQPTEHKRLVVCEGGAMVLRCKPPRVLNIYAAVYGRSPAQPDTCPSRLARPPPFECLNHEAQRLVSKSCHSKHKCVVAVSNQTFQDPCAPGTRKYLSVAYSCGDPREQDPPPTPSPPVDTEKAPPAVTEEPWSKESRRADPSGAMSSSLLAYAYVTEHGEMAALLFTSSVCLGLLLTLLAVSVRVTCRGRRRGARNAGPRTGRCHRQKEDEGKGQGGQGGQGEGADSRLLSAADRKDLCSREEVTYTSEAAERAERIERRDMILQEIWMDAYLNSSSGKL